MALSVKSLGAVLGVFAKEPLAGQVKTRLAQSTSAEWAQRVSRAFLEDSLDRFARIEAYRVIAYSPASAETYFSQLARQQYSLFPQGEGDLGQRLKNFFDDYRGQRWQRIVAVGSDSPNLPIEYIEQAFRLLKENDLVIGPAFDGGYYLIGCGPREFPIFDGIPWSTSRVLEESVRRLESASARFALLPPWYDVDTADDWAMLRGHVLAMRRAGIDPDVPRIERLIQEQTS